MRRSKESGVFISILFWGLRCPFAAGLSGPLAPNQVRLEEAPSFPRSWVPLASTYELDPTKPNALQFLGQSYVAYFSQKADRWVVHDDACPHRLAPLSEGRIDPVKRSTLECSYHGWEFDADGQCQEIPQADDATQKKAKSSSRCNTVSYSVHVEKNLLFVWPWKDDVLSCPVEFSPEAMMESCPDGCSTYTRDLPYGWDTLLENIVDPSHVPFVSIRFWPTWAFDRTCSIFSYACRLITVYKANGRMPSQ